MGDPFDPEPDAKDSPTHSTGTQNVPFWEFGLTAAGIDGYAKHSFALFNVRGQGLHPVGEVLLLPI